MFYMYQVFAFTMESFTCYVVRVISSSPFAAAFDLKVERCHLLHYPFSVIGGTKKASEVISASLFWCAESHTDEKR